MFQRRALHLRTLSHSRARRRGRRGFTFVELLIALAIIGIMAAAIMPALSEVLADRRHAAAPNVLIKLARDAQSRAREIGAAHLVRVLVPSDGLGRFELWMGMNRNCLDTNWEDDLFASTNAAFGPELVEDMEQFNIGAGETPTFTDQGRHVIFARAQPTGGATPTEVWFCYEPNGRAFAVAGAIGDTNLALAPHNTTIGIAFSRRVDSQPRGVTRSVLFIPGTAPVLESDK